MASRFLAGVARGWAGMLQPRAFLALATVIFIAAGAIVIDRNVESPKRLKLLFSGDTHHYVDLAREFASGDFSMAYVDRRPHRQPLYPLLISPVFRWAEGNPRLLAATSAVVIYAAFLLLYGLILWRFRSRFAAALVGVLFLIYPFVREQTTDRLLSEPVHLLLMIGIVFSALDWLERRRISSLLLAGGLAGLDYLDRTNGLFVMAAMLGALGLNELLRSPAGLLADRGREIRRLAVVYAAAVAVFVAVSAPSWIPRLHYYGNPIHHGYLNNYLWVDTYEEGHVGQRVAIYSARDYFATHGVTDVLARWWHGVWNCWFEIPFASENYVPLLYLLAWVGLGVTAWRGPRSFRVIALFGLVQMLPLVWTNLSNPNVRVPLASLLPFEAFFAAYGATLLVGWARKSGVIRRWAAEFDPEKKAAA